MNNTLDYQDIVRNRMVLLWNLGLREYLSDDQRAAICGLALLSENSACYFNRTPRYTFVEEAWRVLGQDFAGTIAGARKRNQCFCLISQWISHLKNSWSDVMNAALSTGAVMCFQQQS